MSLWLASVGSQGSNNFNTDSKDSVQTQLLRRLIRVLAGRKCQLVPPAGHRLQKINLI